MAIGSGIIVRRDEEEEEEEMMRYARVAIGSGL